MAKYDPVTRYLRKQSAASVELSFREIERLIGAMLPKRASQEDWWSAQNDTPQGLAWEAARYRATLIGPERVRFDKLLSRA
jgi:hypothetical protein